MPKVIALFTLATIATAFASTVTEKASDGHNTITYEVDEKGYKRNLASTCVYVPKKAHQCVNFDARGMNCESIPNSGDTVILDDAHRYVVLAPSDYAALTNRIFDLYAKFEMLHKHYKSMNANETGRTAIHGRRGHTTVTNGTIVTEYADGYKHVETVKANRIKPAQFSLPKATKTKATRSEMEAKMEAIRQKRRAALAKTNEVSVVVGGGK